MLPLWQETILSLRDEKDFRDLMRVKWSEEFVVLEVTSSWESKLTLLCCRLLFRNLCSRVCLPLHGSKSLATLEEETFLPILQVEEGRHVMRPRATFGCKVRELSWYTRCGVTWCSLFGWKHRFFFQQLERRGAKWRRKSKQGAEWRPSNLSKEHYLPYQWETTVIRKWCG